MKHTLPLFLAAVCTGMAAQAADLSPQQALNRFNTSAPSIKSFSHKDSKKPLRLKATAENLYIFSNGEGFVILPNDDRAPALLGYSDSGNFTLADNPGLAYWLDFYNNEIQYMKNNDTAGTGSEEVKRVTRQEIKPLIQTEWNQEAPYNEMCPKVDGRETVTGCVATAMAQVLKYHNYPAHGKGTHSYFWRPGEEELTFDYENTPFHWNLMTDRYDDKSTEESRHAVAQLMLACGVSVDMHYEPGESGAATTLMGESLINIFDYSPALWMPDRAYYGYYEWEEMVYSDLAEGLPVLYSGAGTAGGHQFICDGYSSDGFFHFNWGWGGMSNGYFLLTALNPADLGVGGGAGGFNSGQMITLGVRKPKDGDRPVYIMYNTESFESSVSSVKAGEDFVGSGLYFNYSLSNMPDDSRMGLKFETVDGSYVRFVEGPGVGGYHPQDGRRNIEVKFPELPDGTYRITPVLHVDGKWEAVRTPIGYPSEITAIVTDNVAEIRNQTGAEVEVSDVKLPEVIYREREFPMPFTVSNSTGFEYYGTVTPVLTDAAGTVVAESKFRPVDVVGGTTDDVADYIAEFLPVKDQEFPAGDYKLLFRDAAGKYVSSPIDVKVEILTEETKIAVSDFRLDGTDPVRTPEDTRFIFNLKCESGVWYSTLTMFIFPGAGGRDVYYQHTERDYLQGGESKDVIINADLSRLEDGEYMAILYEGEATVSDVVHFRIDRSSATDAISADEAPAECYNINGIRVDKPSVPGLYIIRQGNEVKKMITH